MYINVVFAVFCFFRFYFLHFFGSNNIVVFLTICISYTNNCFTL